MNDHLITDTDTLATLCKSWHGLDYLTVDTEFMRVDTYWPKLCLVQVGAPAKAVAIDPLADGLALDPLFELLLRDPLLKVFHAARQDVEVLLHLTGGIPQPLFDTQIAATVCGFGDSVGYETLAAELAGARIDKTMRFTDWARRPLNERQIRYALDDVTHLRQIYETLAARLDTEGRRDWLAEEHTILTDPATYETAPEEAWRRIKLRSGNRRFLAILRELAAWREREAQARDVPRGRVLKDQALTEVAAQRPAGVKELAALRTVSERAANGATGRALLAAVKRGLAVPDEDCPSPAKKLEKPHGTGPIVDLLKVLLKMRCEEAGVAQRIVATVADLERIAIGDDAEVLALQGWRKTLFGDDAHALRDGRLALSVTNGKVTALTRAEDDTLTPVPKPQRPARRRRRRKSAAAKGEAAD